MSRATQKSILAALTVLPLIAFATSLQYLTKSGVLPQNALLLRGAIHICLLTAWGISVRTRIIQTQVRRYLLAIIVMMALWMLLKIIKHSIDSMDIQRRLWYWYYFPILFIPVVALFVSMSLGKAENYRLPLWTKLLYAPSALLFLLVLTNDLHQGVFSFPSGAMTDIDYRYEAGYYIVLMWVMLCAFVSFAIMLKKCRIPQSKTVLLLPLIPLGLSLIYGIAYIRSVRFVLLLMSDMTVTHCLLIFAAFEGCIQCGLIQSNIGYNALFEATMLPVQITNADFSLRHISAAMHEPIPQDTLRQMGTDTVRLDDDTLLKRHPLHGGWVFWEEDISELNRLHEALELTHDELHDMGNVLTAENAQREKHLRLSEENRLYDMMEVQTSRQIAMLRDRLTAIRGTEDEDTARRLLAQAIVIGTYIKRRNNLIFVSAQRGVISMQELRLCFNESIEGLTLYGVECRALIDGELLLAMEQATQIYDLFEAVVEAGLESLESLLISVETRDWIEVNICVSCKEALCGLKERFPTLEWMQDEDGLQYIVHKLEKSGDRNIWTKSRRALTTFPLQSAFLTQTESCGSSTTECLP